MSALRRFTHASSSASMLRISARSGAVMSSETVAIVVMSLKIRGAQRLSTRSEGGESRRGQVLLKHKPNGKRGKPRMTGRPRLRGRSRICAVSFAAETRWYACAGWIALSH
eukprot:scaffold268_cov236-Pinguiococcus_pyrenoidosus.AAC.16